MLAQDQHSVHYQFAKSLSNIHPVVLCWVVAKYGLGKTAAHVDQVVEGHRRDAALGDGDVGTQHPTVFLWIIALNL